MASQEDTNSQYDSFLEASIELADALEKLYDPFSTTWINFGFLGQDPVRHRCIKAMQRWLTVRQTLTHAGRPPADINQIAHSGDQLAAVFYMNTYHFNIYATTFHKSVKDAVKGRVRIYKEQAKQRLTEKDVVLLNRLKMQEAANVVTSAPNLWSDVSSLQLYADQWFIIRQDQRERHAELKQYSMNQGHAPGQVPQASYTYNIGTLYNSGANTNVSGQQQNGSAASLGYVPNF